MRFTYRIPVSDDPEDRFLEWLYDQRGRDDIVGYLADALAVAFRRTGLTEAELLHAHLKVPRVRAAYEAARAEFDGRMHPGPVARRRR